MLKIKWTDRITNVEVFQRAKDEITFKNLKKNRRHSWIGHTIRHKEFVVNVLKGAIFGKHAVGRPRLQYLKQVTSTPCCARGLPACGIFRIPS
jgi:hypothetical protein